MNRSNRFIYNSCSKRFKTLPQQFFLKFEVDFTKESEKWIPLEFEVESFLHFYLLHSRQSLVNFSPSKVFPHFVLELLVYPLHCFTLIAFIVIS
jgi:hypothetical protein